MAAPPERQTLLVWEVAVSPELPRPVPERRPVDVVVAFLRYLGPWRLASGLATVVTVSLAGWWLLRPPPTPIEASLPFAAPVTSVEGSVSAASTLPRVVVVHVTGAVATPGLVSLGAGARVADAIEAAGGPAAGADVQRLNLALPVADGVRIYVPAEGEDVDDGLLVDGVVPQSESGPLDVNRAGPGELERLPGVGPATAAAIIEHRERHGPFRSVDDLLDVRGIGPAKLAAIRDLVTT